VNSRLLASIIAVAALTALVLAVLPDISTDSDGQSEEESFVLEQRPSMKDGKPLSQGFDDFRPIPPEFLNPGHPAGVMGPKQPIPFDKPDAPPMPPSKHPEYDHDASPEVLEANLEPMVIGDIGEFDPGFVEDAIKFAEDRGMHDIAEILKKKLCAIIEQYMRSSTSLNSADTRASGFDDEVDDEAQFELVEEEEEPEEEIVFFDTPEQTFFIPFCAPIVQNNVILLEL
jgi:hypothetical protein